MGKCDVSSVRGMGEGLSVRGREDEEGEGDKTTEGMRPCFPGLEVLVPGSSDIEASTPPSFRDEPLASGVSGIGAVQSHSKPGFNMRLIVSPSFTGYSFSNLPSACKSNVSKGKYDIFHGNRLRGCMRVSAPTQKCR